MTTVCWTPGMLAIDSCITHSDESDNPQYKTSTQKLYFKVAKDFIVAIGSEGDMDCGITIDELVVEQVIRYIRKNTVMDIEKLHRYLNEASRVTERADIIGEGRYEGILFLTRGGKSNILLICGNGRSQVVPDATPYIAIGVDSAVALGALYHGANALEAVKASCHHSMYTDYPIHAIHDNSMYPRDGALLYVCKSDIDMETFKNLTK